MATKVTTDLNHFDRTLRLFDVMVNGVYGFSSVLNHHVKNAEFENAVLFGMQPMDGVVFLCQHPVLETLNRRIKEHEDFISSCEKSMNIEENGYEIRRLIDKSCYRKKCRLQLLLLCKKDLIDKTN